MAGLDALGGRFPGDPQDPTAAPPVRPEGVHRARVTRSLPGQVWVVLDRLAGGAELGPIPAAIDAVFEPGDLVVVGLLEGRLDDPVLVNAATAAGRDGVDGVDGATGPAGPQGDPGPVGPAGPAGATHHAELDDSGHPAVAIEVPGPAYPHLVARLDQLAPGLVLANLAQALGLLDDAAARLDLLEGDPWHLVGTENEPPFLNGWGNLSTTTMLAYRRRGSYAALSGVAYGGTPGAALFELPEHLWPAYSGAGFLALGTSDGFATIHLAAVNVDHTTGAVFQTLPAGAPDTILAMPGAALVPLDGPPPAP